MLEEDADAVDGFEHGGGAAVGIDGAVDPGIAMIAGDDPLIGEFGAGDGADDVPDGGVLVVHFENQVDLDAGTDVVGEGQRALPFARGVGTAEVLEDGRGVVVAKAARRESSGGW